MPPNSTVRCKGFALTFIDTMLALTEGRGGVFTLSATGYTYTPSGTEPRRIAPFSRSARPMRAKVEAGDRQVVVRDRKWGCATFCHAAMLFAQSFQRSNAAARL